MRKHEKARLKRIREHQAVKRALRHLHSNAENLGLNDKDNTQEDFNALARSLSNRDLRAITNASHKFTRAISEDGDEEERAILDAIVTELAERKMDFERER